ncbi:hypothetical protein LCGC14_1034410 [marine sediment metagenome]|uniref:Roadblock/LAMTOR2 domain-containing protein n=1 Tax=marine sediment metagenome TaxID=412755 RepID=A0A0F9QBT0_9ZZZZ
MSEKNDTVEKLEKVLKKLLINNPDITVAIITSIEGLPILSIIPKKTDETIISAMVSALLSLSERAVIDMKIGRFQQLFIEGIDGYLLVFEALPAVLSVSATKKAKLGLIFFECERTSHEISQILKIKL